MTNFEKIVSRLYVVVRRGESGEWEYRAGTLKRPAWSSDPLKARIYRTKQAAAVAASHLNKVTPIYVQHWNIPLSDIDNASTD